MKPTILLVDIASDDRENQRMFLESQGYEVLLAESEETAEQICQQLQPDLVLLHDCRPRLAGASLCRRLKQDPLNKLTPVVLISSWPTPAEILHGREAGAADIWETPCSLREALDRIEGFLQSVVQEIRDVDIVVCASLLSGKSTYVAQIQCQVRRNASCDRERHVLGVRRDERWIRNIQALQPFRHWNGLHGFGRDR